MFQRKFADNKNSKSIASQLRQQRFRIFSEMINDLPGTVKILDVGGTQNYWEMMKVDSSLMKKVKVTLLNTHQQETTLPNFFSLIGDARYMLQFEN